MINSEMRDILLPVGLNKKLIAKIFADAEMIEIKQGPYCGEEDKVRFEHVPEKIILKKNEK
jgi:hypothetical protein